MLPTIESSSALLVLGSFANCSSRLCGLRGVAVDFAEALGVDTPYDADGGCTAPFQLRAALRFLLRSWSACDRDSFPAFWDSQDLIR
jgi:hypothetical protein